jgi:raffinose/stachyose/melibiose transport system substrate-binding protein
MSKTRVVVVALVVGAVMTLSAAVAAAQPTSMASPQAKRDVVTLRMIMGVTVKPAMDILIANFQRVYPNVRIDATYSTTDQVTSQLSTQFQAGNGPDLLQVRGGNTDSASAYVLAGAGQLMDLTKSPWYKRIDPNSKQLYTLKNKVYAWPTFITPYGAIFNVTLFNQLGLKQPKTFGDVLSLCKKITAAGKIPFAQAFGGTTVSALVLARQRSAQYVFGPDPSWNDKRARKQVTFAGSAGWKRTLQSIVDMKNAGCFAPGAQGTSLPQMYAQIATGDAVMGTANNFDYTSIKLLNPTENLQIMNLPGDSAKQNYLLAASTLAVGANAHTAHPKEAKDFINFLAREQQASLFAKILGGIASLDAKKGKFPAYATPLAPFFKKGTYRTDEFAAWPNPLVLNQGLIPGIIGLITGQTTIDSTLANMDRLWDQ